jgi:predicted AAA+ superfamily ATPase
MKNEVASRLIPRAALDAAQSLMRMFPVLTITGPRQSGKTTLARMLAPDYPYFSLEDPDTLAMLSEDPRRFLNANTDGAIFDEAQRWPDLLSYLQTYVDADRGRTGRFILTGSCQFNLMAKVTQSLAGRSATLTLLPFSLAELAAAGRAPAAVEELLWRGLFPAVYIGEVTPEQWARNYIATYVERDARQLQNIRNLSHFQKFVGLCAGRVGQLLNYESLASDAGIDQKTVRAWLSVLEASHILFFVQPWFQNIAKRLVKTPKLYFCDTGLAAWFLGARTPEYVATLPQRGALFENWVMLEILKTRHNRGETPDLWFLRDKLGHEVDALVQTGPEMFAAVEMKSGETFSTDFFKGLDFWRTHLPARALTSWVIYGGKSLLETSRGTVLPWNDLAPLLATL